MGNGIIFWFALHQFRALNARNYGTDYEEGFRSFDVLISGTLVSIYALAQGTHRVKCRSFSFWHINQAKKKKIHTYSESNKSCYNTNIHHWPDDLRAHAQSFIRYRVFDK